MSSETNGIRDVDVTTSDTGESRVEVVFGPHHRLVIEEDGEDVTFEVAATHHGFKASANDELPTKLESVITHVRNAFPDLATD